MRAALTIAASDSSCGAGAQVDLAVMRELGVYGLCVVTNVTAQNSRGVHKICKVPPRVIAAQIDAVTRDFEVGACKIGMLFSHQSVDVVAERIARREIPNVVLDPIITAKNGEELLRPPAISGRPHWGLRTGHRPRVPASRQGRPAPQPRYSSPTPLL